MKKKMLGVVLAAVLFTIPVSVCAAQLSPGLEVIAYDLEMTKSGLVGRDVIFTRDDFLQATGIPGLRSVTFTTLPPAEDGALYVGQVKIQAGQTVYGEMLDYLIFRAAADSITRSAFCYALPEEYGVPELSCEVLLLDKINLAPSAAMSESVPVYSTLKNMPLRGVLRAADPENDSLSYRIVTAPTKGTVELLSDKFGDFRYTPKTNFTGKDSFSYVVADEYGNYSRLATVNIRISKNKTGISFEDMTGSDMSGAAISVCAAGLLDAVRLGDEYYFEPDTLLTRAELVYAVCSAKNIVSSENSTDSGLLSVFADESTIPLKYRSTVAAAYENGVICGCEENGQTLFRPNEKVTRAEAAVIFARVMNLELDSATVAAFADGDSVPVWAAASVGAVADLGLLPVSLGMTDAASAMSKSDAAYMLYYLCMSDN